MALDSLDLGTLALSPAPGGETTAECPFCGAKRGHFYVNPEKGVYYCHKCGASGRVTDPPRPMRLPANPTVKTAPPHRLDTVYRALLRMLTLSKEHLEHLLTVRGMSREQVQENGYRTLPHGGRLWIAGKVAGMLDPSGVPGFYRLNGGWSLAGCPGLLIPVRDFDSRVVGCQIRTFEQGLPKYVWLSSAGKEGGAGAQTRAHVAYGPKSRQTLWLTEGPLKADISAPKLGVTVVAVPGVNTLRPALTEEIKRRGFKRVVLAFDSDAREKPQVAQAVQNALAMLRGAGLEAQMAFWPQKHKGLDDLLLAGEKPALVKFRGAQKTVNQIYLSGYVRRVSFEDVRSSSGKAPYRRMNVLIDDPKGQPIPAVVFGNTALALESQNPEPGDWIEGEGCIRAWPGKYAEPLANVVLNSARVLKKLAPAWWEQDPQGDETEVLAKGDSI